MNGYTSHILRYSSDIWGNGDERWMGTPPISSNIPQISEETEMTDEWGTPPISSDIPQISEETEIKDEWVHLLYPQIFLRYLRKLRWKMNEYTSDILRYSSDIWGNWDKRWMSTPPISSDIPQISEETEIKDEWVHLLYPQIFLRYLRKLR